MKSLLRTTIYYLPSVLLPRISAFLILIVSARLISETELGLYALGIVVGEIFESSASGWVRIALIRNAGAASETHELSIASVRICALLSSLATVAAVAAGIMFSKIVVPERFAEFALGLALYIVANAILRFGLTLLQIRGLKVGYSMIEVLRSAISLLLVLLILSTYPTFFAALIALTVAVFPCSLASVLLGLRGISPGLGGSPARDYLKFAAPLISLTLLGYCVTNVDRIALKLISGSAAVGVYAAAYAVSRQGFDVLANAVNIGGFPSLVKVFRRSGPLEASRHLTSQALLLLSLCLPAAVLLISMRHEVVTLLLPPNYRPAASPLVPLVAGGAICLALKNFVFDNVFHIMAKNWVQLATVGVGATAATILAATLIPLVGLHGAALAFSGGSAISLLASLFLSARYIPISITVLQLTMLASVTLSVWCGCEAALLIANRIDPLTNLLLGSIGGLAAGIAIFALFFKGALKLESDGVE